MTKEGFTPLDAQKDIGSIESGKVDDLIVVDGNISDNIQDI